MSDDYAYRHPYIIELLPVASYGAGTALGAPVRIKDYVPEEIVDIRIDSLSGSLQVRLLQSFDYDGVMPVNSAHWGETVSTPSITTVDRGAYQYVVGALLAEWVMVEYTLSAAATFGIYLVPGLRKKVRV